MEDFFISSDLSYISGTTSIDHRITLNDRMWVTSPYFPRRQKINVNSLDTVKRNGWIEYPLEVNIESEVYINNKDNINKNIRYIQYNGNTYFQDTSAYDLATFHIEGYTYQVNVNSSSLFVNAKAYIEDGVVIINDTVYKVVFDDDIERTNLLDSVGNKFDIPDNWNLSNVSLTPTYVQKISFGNQKTSILDVKKASLYGYQPYIVVNGDRRNFEVGYNEITQQVDLFVEIYGYKHYWNIQDNLNIPYDVSTILNNTQQYAIYDYVNDEGNPTIAISGIEYEVFFESIEGSFGTKVCLELEKEHESILINDVINCTFNSNLDELPIRTDNNGVDYVYYNTKRCNIINGLCDEVRIRNKNYPINYSNTTGEYHLGDVCTVNLDDDTILYFLIENVVNGKVKTLKRVKKDSDGYWVDVLTMIQSGDVVTYSSAVYNVINCDGALLSGIKLPVETYYKENLEGGTYAVYSYIAIKENLKCQLKVIETIGSNKILCVLNVKDGYLSNAEHFEIAQNTYNDLIALNNCTFTKRPNCFGRLDMTAEAWIEAAYNAQIPTNIYELSRLKDVLSITKSATYFDVPITLSKSTCDDFLKDDLVIGSYYDEKADEEINKLVDMDKDIYVPIYTNPGLVSNNLERITINLHFRTRDMSTWTINEDEGYRISGGTYNENGTYISGGTKVQLGVNSDFDSWFVTDYYPYNQVGQSGSYVRKTTAAEQNVEIKKMFDKSDLLGLLYFTTDDVKKKRNKLSKSFLRFTFFDSIDPTRQNMIGTSTMYFDCDRYFDTITYPPSDAVYESVVMSLNGKRDGSSEGFTADTTTPPTVLGECYKYSSRPNSSTIYSGETNGYLPRLDSRIVVSDRSNTTSSSEGFYAYILKAFGKKNREQTVYAKAEFFHAGIGIKIPMILPTKTGSVNGTLANATTEWSLNELEAFKEGYDLNEIYKRMYIPFDIFYDMKFKQWVYRISGNYGENNPKSYGNTYKQVIEGNSDTEWKLNLFELKIKPQ